MPFAARAGDASEWRLLRVIAFTSVPSAIGIFAFIQARAAFTWPLLVANDQRLFNMDLGLTTFQLRFSTGYGKLVAGSVLSVSPMLIRVPLPATPKHRECCPHRREGIAVGDESACA